MQGDSDNYNKTIGTLAGIFLDTEGLIDSFFFNENWAIFLDPDVNNIENMGLGPRKKMYCIDAPGPANLVKLKANITTSISSQCQPYPSNLKFVFGFLRAPNELIITCPENESTKYRIDISHLELILDRIIVHPNLQLKIENIISSKPLRYTYNRYWIIRLINVK